jgi:hypothetical protein
VYVFTSDSSHPLSYETQVAVDGQFHRCCRKEISRTVGGWAFACCCQPKPTISPNRFILEPSVLVDGRSPRWARRILYIRVSSIHRQNWLASWLCRSLAARPCQTKKSLKKSRSISSGAVCQPASQPASLQRKVTQHRTSAGGREPRGLGAWNPKTALELGVWSGMKWMCGRPDTQTRCDTYSHR